MKTKSIGIIELKVKQAVDNFMVSGSVLNLVLELTGIADYSVRSETQWSIFQDSVLKYLPNKKMPKEMLALWLL